MRPASANLRPGSSPVTDQPTIEVLHGLAAEMADPATFARRPEADRRQTRASFADALAALDAVSAGRLLASGTGDLLRTIISIRQDPLLTASEQERADSLNRTLGGRLSAERLPAFLALSLYRPPHRALSEISFAGFASPQDEALVGLLSARPLVSIDADDPARFAVHAERLLAVLLADIEAGHPGAEARAQTALADFSTLQAFFADDALLGLMTARARLLERLLESEHRGTGSAWPALPGLPARRPLRLAFLVHQVSGSPEGYFNLAHYEAIDRHRITVDLFATQPRQDGPFADRAIAAADRYVELSGPPAAMAETVRETRPDIALIGGNIVATTAPTSPLSRLSAFRLAPWQGVNMCTPTTTGLRSVDFYLTGDTLQPSGADADFSETLIRLPGGAKQFALPAEATVRDGPETGPVGRAELGLPDDATVLVSGANFHKIVPELSTAWIDILRRTGNTVLALFPFNPNWSPVYMARPFMDRLSRELSAAEVASDRLILLRPQATAGAVRQYVAQADLYLDSYPYSGAVSLVDPLLCGVPPVVWRGRHGRSRQASSILEALGLAELIADDRDSFVGLAASLAMDADRRREVSARTRDAMTHRPAVLDGPSLAAKLADALEEMVTQRPSVAPS